MKKGLKELTEGMQRLCAVANRIVAENGKTSRIDIDLLLENLRGLYDTALRLAEQGDERANDDLLSSTMMATRAAMQPAVEEKVESEPVAPVVPIEPETSPASQPSEPEPEAIPANEPAPAEPAEPHMVEAFEGNENGLLFDEVIIEPEPAVDPEPVVEPEPIVEPVVEPAPIVEPTPVAEPAPAEEPQKSETHGQASLLDYLKEAPAVRTLGESLGMNANQPSNLEPKVNDLRTVININDKFSFITELFHSNMRGYNDFIMQLNDIADRDTAEAFVNRVAEQNKWDENTAAVKAFRKIFDKKF
jgi:hypothetical protein